MSSAFLILLSAKFFSLIRDMNLVYTRILFSNFVGFSMGAKRFSLFKSIQNRYEPAHPLIQWVTGIHFPWLKQLEHQIKHLPSLVPRVRMTPVTLSLAQVPSLSAYKFNYFTLLFVCLFVTPRPYVKDKFHLIVQCIKSAPLLVKSNSENSCCTNK